MAEKIKLKEIYDRVSRRADLVGVSINCAETSRVLACLFDALYEIPTDQILHVLGCGFAMAKKRAEEKS